MPGSLLFEDYFGYLQQYYVHKYQDVLEYFKQTAEPGPAFLNSLAATKVCSSRLYQINLCYLCYLIDLLC